METSCNERKSMAESNPIEPGLEGPAQQITMDSRYPSQMDINYWFTNDVQQPSSQLSCHRARSNTPTKKRKRKETPENHRKKIQSTGNANQIIDLTSSPSPQPLSYIRSLVPSQQEDEIKLSSSGNSDSFQSSPPASPETQKDLDMEIRSLQEMADRIKQKVKGLKRKAHRKPGRSKDSPHGIHSSIRQWHSPNQEQTEFITQSSPSEPIPIKDDQKNSTCSLHDDPYTHSNQDNYNYPSQDQIFTGWFQPNAMPEPFGYKLNNEPELCEEQQALVNLILSGKNVFYTGSAGSGKSTVLKAFVAQLQTMGKTVNIIAPTGRAAVDINGQTIYTFAGWTPDSMKYPIKVLESKAHGKFVHERLARTDVLVMDEISMIENHVFERLNRIMKASRGSSLAFGGVQMVVSGDFCQLPPVRPFKFCLECGRSMISQKGGSSYKCISHGEFLDVDKWAFRSKAWGECAFHHVNLNTIHRQKDQEFIDILEKCRLNKLLTPGEAKLLLDHECDVTNAVKLYPTREEVRRVNETEFARLTTERRCYQCIDTFKQMDHHPHLKFKATRNPDGTLLALKEHRFEALLELKVGMQVILLVNLEIDAKLCNGSQGAIVGWEPLDPKKLPTPLKSNSKESDFRSRPMLTGEYAEAKAANIKAFIKQAKVEAWPIVRFEHGVTRTIMADCTVNQLGDEAPYSYMARTQIPLIPAWAMSIHKSQGMTLSKVVVDLSRIFEDTQLYVALSRARSLDGLKVIALGRRSTGPNEEVMQFLKEKFGIE